MQTLADLDFDAMLATGYAFQVETTMLAHLMGKRIEEVPFVFSERIAGTSKMSMAISLEGVRVTVALRRRHRVMRAGRALEACVPPPVSPSHRDRTEHTFVAPIGAMG